MEWTKIMRPKTGPDYRLRIFLMVLMAACFTACGPQVIKGRPPFVSISGVSQEGDNLMVEFDVRNQNGVPMTIDRVEITVMVDDNDFSRENRKFDLLVGANSAEHIRVDELPDEFRRSLLESLESGEVKSLPFDLRGKVHTLEDGNLTFEHKGYLYPVPGKPGHFRAAVTQAQGLQREEKF